MENRKRTPFLLDCDTGVDDAIAILLSKQLDKLELVAITSVAGNAEIEKTTFNALYMRELAGLDAPVYRGAEKPMFGTQVTAPYVHGQNGLADLPLHAPKRGTEPLAAWDAIYETAKAYAGELVVVAIGPLTNLALAFTKYKDLAKYIKRIVIMGGAAVGGNVTPAAEFNIYVDPEAADIVFTAGAPIHMCGLDVTVQAYLTPEEIEQLGALGSRQARFARDVTQGVLRYSLGLKLPGMCMHDPVTLLYAEDDSYFEYAEAGVRVETKGRITRGKTVCDLYSDKQMAHNAVVVTGVDRERMRERIFALMRRYDA